MTSNVLKLALQGFFSTFQANFNPVPENLNTLQQPAGKSLLQVYSELQQYGSNFGRHGKYVSVLTQHFCERET